MISFFDIFEAVRSHPYAMAGVIVALAIATRIVGRLALYGMILAVIASVVAVWTD